MCHLIDLIDTLKLGLVKTKELEFRSTILVINRLMKLKFNIYILYIHINTHSPFVFVEYFQNPNEFP